MKANKEIVESYMKENGWKSIEEWMSDNRFVDKCGFDGYVFKDYDEAIMSLRDGGENRQNAINFAESAGTEEDWVKWLFGCGVDEDVARSLVENGEWGEVVDWMLEEYGPEWFLSSYSGSMYDLPDGTLLFY